MSGIFDKTGSPGQQINWETRKPGVDLAKVTSIKDPDGLNRVKCKLLSEDTQMGETDWCFVMTPFGAKEHGIFFHPNVNDIVVLSYIGGDVHRPCVIGSVWTSEVTAPYKIAEEKNENFSIKTPQKSEILFVDTKDKEVISITTPKGSTIVISDAEKKITVSDKEKKNHIDLMLESGELTVEAEKKITLKTGKSSVTMDSEGNLSIDAKTKIAMSTATFEVKATGEAKIQASGSATYKANGAMTVQSSAVTTVKGSMVKIN